MAKLIKVKGFMNGEDMLLNSDLIIRAVNMREQDGCVVTMTDGNKIFIQEDIDEILKAVREGGCDGSVCSGTV